MNNAYMQSAPHRQNQLGAAYNLVGVGVTCADNQAFTVEVFGYAYGDLSSAFARENSQNATQGDPVPASPMVAGTNSGDPVYCPGQTYGPNGQITATGGQYPYPYPVPPVPGEPNAGVVTAVGIAGTANAHGYWVVRSNGSVADFGDAKNYGSMVGANLVAPISHLVPTPNGRGYWLVAADGGIFSFGDAGFYGSMGGHPLNAPVVDLAPTSDGRGYWLVASDGGIFAFDAPFHGSAGNLVLNWPVNGMAPTANGRCYWMVGWDGAIFAFGNARFHGSTGGLKLNAPMVGMAADRATGGYWLVGSDGGVFAFDAPFYGHA
jgi:hypothetical protein